MRFPKPVDRSLWGMFPQTVNAYYSPFTNQITFPAAILQAPFFDPAADPAANYGAIGAVIGHEMGHGFDDEGRKFDAKGSLRDWWSPAAVKAYSARTDKLVAQYSAFSPYPGVNVNGKLTLGENLGDLSGVEAAYAAVVEAKGREEAWSRAEHKAKQWIVTIESQIDLGTSDERALTEPLRAYINARAQHLVAIMDYNVTESQLAMASGWDTAAPASN